MIKVARLICVLFLSVCCIFVATSYGGDAKTAVTGVALPEGYRQWVGVAPSHRTDKGHMRMMLANPVMVKAYAKGTLPFPDGSVLVKLVYEAVKSDEWEDAIVPGEAMTKDSAKYPTTGGWGFGRFSPEGEPRGDAQLYESCFPCHEANVKGHDYIFTRWAK